MDQCAYATMHLARIDVPRTVQNLDVAPPSDDPVAWMVGGGEMSAGTRPGSQATSSSSE